MRYRNTRTGTVIESAAQISGGGWVEDRPFSAAPQHPVQTEKKAEEPLRPKKKRTGK